MTPDILDINGVKYVRMDKAMEHLTGLRLYGMDVATIEILRRDFRRRYNVTPLNVEQVRKAINAGLL